MHKSVLNIPTKRGTKRLFTKVAPESRAPTAAISISPTTLPSVPASVARRPIFIESLINEAVKC